MDRDIGEYIGLIAVSSGAIVLGLSYMAAYMLGRDRGRKEHERIHDLNGAMADQRLNSVETAVHSLEKSVERLMDAQRLLAAQQDHLTRKVGGVDRHGFGAIQGRHTPA